jgi:hypothetical protein
VGALAFAVRWANCSERASLRGPLGPSSRARLPSWATGSRPATATRPAPQSPDGARPVRLLRSPWPTGPARIARSGSWSEAPRRPVARVAAGANRRHKAPLRRSTMPGGRAAAVRADLRQRGRSRAPRVRAGRPIARKAGGPIRRQARLAEPEHAPIRRQARHLERACLRGPRGRGRRRLRVPLRSRRTAHIPVRLLRSPWPTGATRIVPGGPWSEAPGKAGITNTLRQRARDDRGEPQSQARRLAGEPRR